MNIFTLVWSYLRSRPLNTFINILLLSLGIAVITLLLLFNKQMEERISSNSKGIDLVVGAKGSPLQIILCNVFHIDFPTGNISLPEAERIATHRLVKKAIPIALGDSYGSYRIVGTNHDYAAIYGAEVAEGKWFESSLEVTIGSNVAAMANLKNGDRFSSAHGLSDMGHSHDEHKYVVVGILEPSNSVLDNLILTKVESVWMVHEEHGAEESADHEHDHDHEFEGEHASPVVPSVHRGDSTKQVTSLILQYRNPMAAVQLPRIINDQTTLQAASPAFETARLYSILGVGVDILMAFAYVLILISALSIFIALYNSLKERKYDLAVLRSMGAGRTKLLVSVLLEGILLTLVGSVLGVALAHVVVWILSVSLPAIGRSGLSAWVFYSEEWIILLASLLLGGLCAFIPAIQAYRTDISKVLSGNA